MSSGLAPGSTPSTAWGSLAGTTRVYRPAPRGSRERRRTLDSVPQARSAVRMPPVDDSSAPAGRASPPRSPRCRSRSPTASRSCTGCGRAIRTGTRRSGRRTSVGPRLRGDRDPVVGRPAAARLVHPRRARPRRPGVVLVHGWESARDRTIPHAQVLHAAGFHVLTFDVRGNGANGPEALPMSVGEYAADARAAVAELRRRPEVTTIGAARPLDGAARARWWRPPRTTTSTAVIAASTPADPYRLTRQTFRLARLPDPGADRLAARLADDPRLPPASRPHGPLRERDQRRARHRPAGDARSTASDDGVVPSATSRASPRPAGPPGPTRSPRPCSSRAAGTRGCTSSRSTAPRRPVPHGEPRRSVHARRGRRGRRGRAGRAPARPGAADHARRGARRLPVAVAGAPAPGVGRSTTNGATPPEPTTDGSARHGDGRAPRPRRDDPGMNVREAVHTKRAIRSFDGRPLARPTSTRSSTRAGAPTARRTSSAGRSSSCEDRERLQALSTVGPFAGHIAGAAAAVALVTPDPYGPDAPMSILWDLGGAAAQMMLVAWDLGVGSCPATVYEPDEARGSSASRRTCTASTSSRSATRPTRPPSPPPTRPAAGAPLDELVHHERWEG